MILPTDPDAKCLGRSCSQAFLCWRFLAPDAGEEQKWANYDESRRLVTDQKCPGFRSVPPRAARIELYRKGRGGSRVSGG
jgi:hypothetical protein